MTVMTSFENCSKRVYFKGRKIPKDPGYPCSAWGSYLPGDEPGYYCSETEEECNESCEIGIDECPRMSITDIKVKLDDDTISTLWRDEDSDDLYSPEDNNWFLETEIDELYRRV